MTTPEQELTESLASACLRARDRGMRYAAILDTIRTIEARVRVSQRAAERIHATRQDRTTNPSLRPMRSMVAQIMKTQLPAQKAG